MVFFLGNCHRLLFSLGLSQHIQCMHEISNLHEHLGWVGHRNCKKIMEGKKSLLHVHRIVFFQKRVVSDFLDSEQVAWLTKSQKLKWHFANVPPLFCSIRGISDYPLCLRLSWSWAICHDDSITKVKVTFWKSFKSVLLCKRHFLLSSLSQTFLILSNLPWWLNHKS